MAGYITTGLDSWYIRDALGDPKTKTVFSYGSANSLASMFAKVDYNFAGKYYLSGTIRRDGSSKFGPNNRYGTFPAFSAGWRLSDESFMQGISWLSDLKIRGGWGITGNQNVPGGRVPDLFGGDVRDTFYAINGGNGIVTGYRKTAIGNNDMKWEENVSQNVGFDLSLFDSRLTVAFDVFTRTIDGLLGSPPLTATYGRASAPVVNIGKMQNNGYDFSIGYKGGGSGDFTWSVDFNGGHYKNEILSINGETTFFYGPVTGRGAPAVINQIGYPIGSFYGYQVDGIFQNQEEVDDYFPQAGKEIGRFRFAETTGDDQVNASDRTVIGNPHPDFTGGLNFGAQYKKFDFNMFWFGSFGNEIFDITKEFTVFRLFYTNVRKDRLTDSWTPEKPNAKYPQLDQTDQYSSAYSSFYVEDASYVRLRNLQVGYNFPANTTFSRLRLYVSGQNLLTFTGYSGYDPALPTISSNGPAGEVSDQAMGLDRGTYPNNKIFSIGLNATF